MLLPLRPFQEALRHPSLITLVADHPKSRQQEYMRSGLQSMTHTLSAVCLAARTFAVVSEHLPCSCRTLVVPQPHTSTLGQPQICAFPFSTVTATTQAWIILLQGPVFSDSATDLFKCKSRPSLRSLITYPWPLAFREKPPKLCDDPNSSQSRQKGLRSRGGVWNMCLPVDPMEGR